MKKLLLLIGLVFALLIASNQAALSAGLNRITGPELETMMKDGSQIAIVDVREPELYAKGHVPGAININYYDRAHTRILKELKSSDRIVFICHGGPMGDELGKILVNNGYPKVYNVIGGMRKWKGPLSVK